MTCSVGPQSVPTVRMYVYYGRSASATEDSVDHTFAEEMIRALLYMTVIINLSDF